MSAKAENPEQETPTHRVVAVAWDPWPSTASRSPLGLYRRAVRYKANPRDREYLEKLFRERYACGRILDWVPGSPPVQEVEAADEIVLLYPDAIGLGFTPLEREVFRRKAPRAAVRVLNGRRRRFLLSRGVLRGLRVRRFLERTMLFEAVFSLFFLVATPLLWIWDLVRGRR